MYSIESRMNAFRNSLIEMSDLVYDQLVQSFSALDTHDKTRALDIIERDETVNAMESNIHNQTVEILGRMQPLARDLRLLIGGIRIANDLERMGDYAKSIARYIVKFDPITGKTHDSIMQMNNYLSHFIYDAFQLIREDHDKDAHEVALLDDTLDAMFKSVIYRIVDDRTLDPQTIIQITGVLRNVERAGDHAKNICESSIYIETGDFIDFD